MVVAARRPVAPLFALVPGIDDVVTLEWRGRLLNRGGLEADIARLREGKTTPGLVFSDAAEQTRPGVVFPGVAILLTNSFATAWLVRRAGIAERWGYATDWRRSLLTRAIPVPRASVHQGRYYQQLVAGLGISNGPLEPHVEVPGTALEQARTQLRAAGWDGQQPLVAIAAGAAYGTAKRWLPGHFARLIADLGDRQVRAVLIGSAGDAETTRQILADGPARAAAPIDLVGQTTLERLAGVLAISSICVANDSGAMHLAGAIGTPIVALFGPTREAETAPLTRAGGRAEVLLNPVWCRPCMLRECPIDHRCMRDLPPARVLASVIAPGPPEGGHYMRDRSRA
jgi:heptosyltransferase II